MADLSKVKLGDQVYNLKDAEARTGLANEVTRAQATENAIAQDLTNEVTRAKGVEGGLDKRVSNLEARGRYLSTWDVSTGLPGDYPEIPEGATSPYTYTYKAGDYYIINNIPSTGSQYMPDGAEITATKSGDVWTWSVGKKVYSSSSKLVVGGQFIYSKSSWTYVATAKDVAWGNITGSLSDQTDLSNALAGKVDKAAQIAGVAINGGIGKAELQAALELGSMAYVDKGEAKVPSQSITGVYAKGDLTGGLILGSLAHDSNNKAELTKIDYTPSGEITGSAISGGSINVTIKDAATASDITNLTYESYTPTGTITSTEGGTSDVINEVEFKKEVVEGTGVQIEGTVSKPDVNFTPSLSSALSSVNSAGQVPSFTEGTFTPASVKTQVAFAKAGLVASIGEGEEAECLIFTSADTANAVTEINGGSKAADTWNAGSMPTFNSANYAIGGSAALASAPTFTGDKYALDFNKTTVLNNVKFTGVAENIKFKGAKYLKQEINEASFSGCAASLGFAGDTVSQALVTEVKYDRVIGNGDLRPTFDSANLAVDAINVAEKTIDVTPKA